jgi:hypothetical protein
MVSHGTQERMLRRGVLPYAGRRSSFVVIVVVRNAMLNCRLKNKKWRRSKEEAKKRIDGKKILVANAEFEYLPDWDSHEKVPPSLNQSLL